MLDCRDASALCCARHLQGRNRTRPPLEVDTIGLIGKLVGAALMPVVLGAAVLGAGPMLVVGAPAALAAAALMDDD